MQGYFTFLPLGQRQIRGHDPVQVFQLTGRQSGRTRIDIAAEHGLTAFVGRQQELALLDKLLKKTKGGHGQIVGVLGGESLCHLAYAHYLKLSEEQLPFVEQYTQEALRLSQQMGEHKIRARGLTSLGLVQQWRGTLLEAEKTFEESL